MENEQPRAALPQDRKKRSISDTFDGGNGSDRRPASEGDKKARLQETTTVDDEQISQDEV